MKRKTTILVLCALMFAADLIWLRLIMDGRPSLLNLQASIAFAGPFLAATTLLAIAYLVLRKKYTRQKRPARRLGSLSQLRPLRRLLASVLP